VANREFPGHARVAFSFSSSEVKAYCSARLPQLREHNTERRGPCPLHQGSRDSFAINAENGLWTCHACGRSGDLIKLERELAGTDFKTALASVLRFVGRSETTNGSRSKPPLVVAEYDYKDETGKTLYQTVRYDPKEFKQRQPDPNGGWIWNLKGVRHVLFRLPELTKRVGETVFVCEGEKDVLALEAIGFLATCNPMGAGKWKDPSVTSKRMKNMS